MTQEPKPDNDIQEGLNTPDTDSPSTVPIKKIDTFTSLLIPNFRFLLIGSIFANSIMWIQQMIMSWLVYDITGSGTMLGTVNLVAALSSLFMIPIAGVLVDRLMGLASTLVLAIASYLLFMREQGVFQVSRHEPGPVRAFFDKHPVSGHQILLTMILLVGVMFVLAGWFDLKGFFRKIYGHFTHLLSQLKTAVLVYYHHPLVLVFGLLVFA